MHIVEIEINNFRSIRNAKLNTNGFNILVGQNNHGKTNFLEAIEWFFNGSGDTQDIKRKNSGNEELFVKVVFSGAQEGLSNMKNLKNQATLKSKIGDSDIVTIICRPGEKNGVDRQILDSYGEWVGTGTGANNFLNDFLPKLQFVKTDIGYKDVAKYGTKTEIGQMLSGVINEILISEDEEYKEFINKFEELFVGDKSKVAKEIRKIGDKVAEYLSKQFEDCADVTFEVKTPKFEDLLKNFDTKIDDGHVTTVAEKGDGMQRALMLSIIQTYADYRRSNENIKNFIFLIDEAELHLHPTAQRSLKNALIELSNGGDQVFVSTHSSVIISDDNEGQKIFKVEKDENITYVDLITRENKASIVYDLLGGNPADLLLPKNFLLVEGKSERTFLEKVIERFYQDKPEIQIIPVWGDIEKADRVFDNLSSVFSPLEKSLYADRVIILLDKISKDKESKRKDFFYKHPMLRDSVQIIEIDVSRVEEYYPIAKEHQIGGKNQQVKWKLDPEDKIDSHGKQTLAKHIGANIEKDQFEKEMPIIYESLVKCWDNSY